MVRTPAHRMETGGLRMNDRVLGTTQHSQKENSQAEKISLRAFRSQWGVSGEGSTFNSVTTKQLQELNKINCHAESKFSEGRRVSVANPARKLWQNHVFDTTRIISSISASSHLQAVMTSETQNDHCEISPVARFRNKFGMTSPSRGMSKAKAEQQSTETLSFRCWSKESSLHISRSPHHPRHNRRSRSDDFTGIVN